MMKFVYEAHPRDKMLKLKTDMNSQFRNLSWLRREFNTCKKMKPNLSRNFGAKSKL